MAILRTTNLVIGSTTSGGVTYYGFNDFLSIGSLNNPVLINGMTVRRLDWGNDGKLRFGFTFDAGNGKFGYIRINGTNYTRSSAGYFIPPANGVFVWDVASNPIGTSGVISIDIGYFNPANDFSVVNPYSTSTPPIIIGSTSALRVEFQIEGDTATSLIDPADGYTIAVANTDTSEVTGSVAFEDGASFLGTNIRTIRPYPADLSAGLSTYYIQKARTGAGNGAGGSVNEGAAAWTDSGKSVRLAALDYTRQYGHLYGIGSDTCPLPTWWVTDPGTDTDAIAVWNRYDTVLKRFPDESGFQFYVAKVKDVGTSVLNGIVSTPEEEAYQPWHTSVLATCETPSTVPDTNISVSPLNQSIAENASSFSITISDGGVTTIYALETLAGVQVNGTRTGSGVLTSTAVPTAGSSVTYRVKAQLSGGAWYSTTQVITVDKASSPNSGTVSTPTAATYGIQVFNAASKKILDISDRVAKDYGTVDINLPNSGVTASISVPTGATYAVPLQPGTNYIEYYISGGLLYVKNIEDENPVSTTVLSFSLFSL